MAAALQFDRVTHVFGSDDPFVAVQDINFDIASGEFVSLVGPSGCGKSTILKIAAGLLPASEGEVNCHGEPVLEPRADIGLMFQTPTLFPWRTVVRNITLPLEVSNDRSGNRDERVAEVLDLVRLTDFANHYPRELSGGMQQRVALCRLLISDPRLMLMDEPFGALDEFTREHLNAELARISEYAHKTTLFVTHNIDEAVFLSDRVVVMGVAPGRILDSLDVDLPRPRVPALRKSQTYTDITNRIRELLGLG